MMGVGLVGTGLLARGPRTLGPMGLDVHSMLYFSAAVIIGAQLIQFALLVKWIAVIAEIVREPPWVARARRHTSIEFGLVVGALVFIAGIAWTLALVSSWRTTGFSALDPQSTMRSVIPAVTMMVIGLQASAGALLAGALQLAWKTSRNK